MPEDEIEVEYKLDNSKHYKSLSTASAGQKTTAILTFILSYGESPLILDQPEDDLDNRLVYDLIVKRLTTAKEKRQTRSRETVKVNSLSSFFCVRRRPPERPTLSN